MRVASSGPPDTLRKLFMNIVSLVDQHARNAPGAPAVVGGESPMTYGELADATSQFASLLANEYNVVPGDRIGIVLQNTPEFVVGFLGAMRMGAVAVPLNTRLRDQDLGPLLEQVRARVVLVGRDRASALSSFEVIDADSLFDTISQRSDGARIPCAPLQWSDVCNIVFTSGSTSRPKAVLQTHGMHMSTGAALADFLQLSNSDVTSLISPMFHVAGITMLATALTLGCPFVLHAGWQRDKALAEMEEHGVSFVHLVGTVFLDILSGERDEPSALQLSRLRYVLAGGAVIDSEKLRWFEDRFDCRISGAYGRTEGGKTWCTPTSPTRWSAHGSVNRNVCEIRIVGNTDDAELGVGQTGEIRVRGDGVSLGYDTPELNSAAFDSQGWMRTGDQGFIDADNVLHFAGRADGIIKSAGENVSPQEVERALVRIRGVSEAIVTGIPHERLGQTVGALIVGDASLTAERVQASARELLAGFKIPRTIAFADQLPRLGSQKVDVRAVKELIISTSSDRRATVGDEQ